MTVNGYLLDTNVLSESSKPDPDEQVVAFLETLALENVFVSAITLAELERGAQTVQRTNPAKAQRLRTWLETDVLPNYEANIIPFDRQEARAWGQLLSTEAARKQPPAKFDSLIAATAYAHRLTLVTRNTADFEAFPISVLNPWENNS